jgi:hypothetical protein
VVETHDLMESSRAPAFWEEYLAANPDVLHRMLADLYQATTGSREAPDTLEQLWSAITPTFSHQPFGEAVMELLGEQSLRSLALRTPFAVQVLHRWVRGERPVVSVNDVEGSMWRLEQVAKALRVHPSHFAEWRRLWALSLVDGAFATNPNLSVAFFRKFSRLERANAR